jgi:radical SAM superfamily enzyme YgiQ (UPF0313 family)
MIKEHTINFLKKKTTNRVVTVAFVNPPNVDWSLANNAAYLMFQSHYKRNGKYPKNIKWLPAPYRFNSYSSYEKIYNDVQNADIYLFSSYIWNYDIVDGVAKHVKKVLPNSLCILGGPHVGTNESSFLEERKSIYDFICQVTKPGEVFVEDLLNSYIDNDGIPNYEEITWEIRSKKMCDQMMPDYSVYADHVDYLKETREYARNNQMEPFSIIETTRGCPYQCVYCEWGGGIGSSKIHQKPIEIIKQDLLALKKAGFRDTYLTDANFGVFFERDVEIFKYAFNLGINLTDISTVKHRSLKRRIELVDAWFDVIGTGPERHSPTNIKQEAAPVLMYGSKSDHSNIGDLTNNKLQQTYVSVVPTVSIQSISDEAMTVAKRKDLSFDDKIKLSEHIRKRCHEEGYPVPALELILGMPGSTKNDFYEEFNIIWNFKSWNSFRHDYMFLPDSELTEKEYIDKYKIELVEVYTDLMDEEGVDNEHSLYRNKKTYFKTISSCYSYSFEDMVEMWFMNTAGNFLLRYIYSFVQEYVTPSEFGKICYSVIKDLDEFQHLNSEIRNILNSKTPTRNIRRLMGKLRVITIENFLTKYKTIIYSEVISKLIIEKAS